MGRESLFAVGDTLPDPHHRALAEIAGEVARAIEKFAPFNSPHEGWAVIREEMDELWEHVRSNTGTDESARVEAIQIAAMALRYAADLTDYQGKKDAERRAYVTENVTAIVGESAGEPCTCGWPEKPCLRVMLRNGPPFPKPPCERST